MKRALIVGAGGMGRTWGRNLAAHPETEIAGWCDVSLSSLEAACAEIGVTPEIGNDFAALLDQVRPDFVVDVTPPEIHHDVVTHALRAGYPVLGEKPMAHSMEAARAMVAASEESGKLYMVSQSRRYNAELVAFCDLVRQIGDIGILNADFYLGPHFGGFRDEMPSPLVLDMAIHTFDAARKIAGQDFVGVEAREWNPGWSWMKGDSSAEARFTTANGGVFHYRGSWVAHGCMTSWESEWRAHGSLGGVRWDGFSGLSGEVVEGSEGFFYPTRALEPHVPPQFRGGIEGSLDEFLWALETGGTPQGECHDNIKSLAMVFAVIQSAAERREVRLDEV